MRRKSNVHSLGFGFSGFVRSGKERLKLSSKVGERLFLINLNPRGVTLDNQFLQRGTSTPSDG